MTDIKPGDRVRVTYETTVDADGHYFGAGFIGGPHEDHTVEVIERHNPRTTEPVGTVVKLTDTDDKESPVYIVKIGRGMWADLQPPHGAVRVFTDDDNRDAEYVGHVSQIEHPDGYVFMDTTDKPVAWSESATEDTDVSSKPSARYWRRPEETKPELKAEPGDIMHDWEGGLAGLVECDADGFAYRRDTNDMVLASRGNEHIFWDGSEWDADDHPTWNEPHTPITPADLTTAQRSAEK